MKISDANFKSESRTRKRQITWVLDESKGNNTNITNWRRLNQTHESAHSQQTLKSSRVLKLKSVHDGQTLGQPRRTVPPYWSAVMGSSHTAQSVSGAHYPVAPFYTRLFKDTGSRPPTPQAPLVYFDDPLACRVTQYPPLFLQGVGVFERSAQTFLYAESGVCDGINCR